ncbi:fimbrial biogenesis chaperone [Cognatilysobacter lacus]|uniref:Molecular chaperone n=1 Tax=Cognatilysobacter lacus TaxID=1643323 RepID=A0A5D8Z8K0_9GAMM|nr:fimbria/pilus periplasmic chaperone [Lysobacter lacus]TZF90977.1 molecular chaperone [Lysobacter lacus]
MQTLRALLVASLVLAASAAGTADARGRLQTRQTRVELAPGARAGRIVLANSGDAPLAAQIRVFRWTQRDGDDVLEPATDLVASPQVVEIAAGTDQLVRIVRTAGGPVASEMAYRVIVEELPGDPTHQANSAVAVRMRYLIPAFVQAADAAPEALSCRVEKSVLVCRNDGGHAVQLGASTFVDATGRSIELSEGLLGYVLAGSTRHFPFDAKALANAAPRELKVFLNGAPSTLVLAAP